MSKAGTKTARTVPPVRATKGRGSVAEPHPFKFTFVVISFIDTIAHVRDFGRCLGSLQAQTDQAFEIIIAHDGPSALARASYQDALAAFGQARVRYIEFPHRGTRGGHHMVDGAVDMAQGEYITLLNQDNTIRPTYVEDMYDAEADVITCMVLLNDSPGMVTSGRGFTRGAIDRLNYTIRRSLAILIHHQMHMDADYDYLQDACTRVSWGRHPRVKHIEKLLGEHN